MKTSCAKYSKGSMLSVTPPTKIPLKILLCHSPFPHPAKSWFLSAVIK